MVNSEMMLYFYLEEAGLIWTLPQIQHVPGSRMDGCAPARDHGAVAVTPRPELVNFNSIQLCPSNFPGGSDGKASTYNAGGLGSIPGLGRSPGGGNGNPLQYLC